MRYHAAITILAAALVASSPRDAVGQTPSVPVPQPFPGATTPPASGPARAPQAAPAPGVPAPPPVAPASTAAPVPAGIPLYPTAEYLGAFDAGAGQQYLLYGTNLPYTEIVAYYKTTLKNGGREIFRAPMPLTHQFDIGRYNEERMAFPPSVVVKDYTWNNSPGYLFVVGTTEKRYKTVIQIVAPGPTP